MNLHTVTVLRNCYSSDGVHQNHGNHQLGLMRYVCWHTRKGNTNETEINIFLLGEIEGVQRFIVDSNDISVSTLLPSIQ